MVERSRRGKGKKRLLGSHNRCWIWGRNAVLETLRAGRWPVLELHLAATLEPPLLAEARRLTEPLGVPTTIRSEAELTRLCHTGEHQGFVAKMPPFPYSDPTELLGLAGCTALVILDRVQDPYNFGAILRSAEVLGMAGVFVGETGQAEVNSLVVRSSAGAVNSLPIARVSALPKLARQLKDYGFNVVAASEKAERELFGYRFQPPVAIVIGNEGRGIHEELLSECSDRVRIPQVGRVASLNAAVSAGILFYELRRQLSASNDGR